MIFFKNLSSNSLPKGKSFQSNVTKFPHPGLHIAIKYPKAEPKKGTMKISPNKTLQSLFINVAASPKIHVPVTAAIIRFNYTFLRLNFCLVGCRGRWQREVGSVISMLWTKSRGLDKKI